MLSKKDLENYRNTTRLNLGQIERDYLQHLVLLLLYKITDRHLIFKGGTALHKVYGLPRFSEDLDFTICEEFTIQTVFEKLCKELKIIGCDSSFEIKKDMKFGKTIRLKMNGPLYNGRENSKFYLILEMSNRENVILDSQTKEIVPAYSDISPYLVKVMDLKEVFAEKVRAIITREVARDVFDLNFLLEKNIKPDLNLINEKLKYYNKSFEKKEFKEAIESKEKLWKKDLTPLILTFPEYDSVKKRILREFNINL